ncbi:MAG: hypothetical protein QG585_96 [Patescibacteria group bacterium]|jgi:hypothetical protein|nr:hypothetical protein [Patescibacteria group bacterium]
MLKFLRFIFRFLLGIGLCFIILAIALNIFTTPSNDRLWNTDQLVLAETQFIGDLVTIRNIRNFTYKSPTDYEAKYYDKTFDLKKIKKVYYVVEPFSGYPGAAHTFLSFEFEGNQFVSISVEIRKEVGETYSATQGLFNQYELMYVIADERDVIGLRANHRKDEVFVYPMKADKEKTRALFVDMLERANKLSTKPEFYNTILNTCTTNIVDHVNKISEKRIPFSLEILFPKNSDQKAYNLGLIDTELPFEEARKKFKVNERAEKYKNNLDFSVRIRN